MEYKQYRRKGLSEMRPYIPGETLDFNLSVSPVDVIAGHPSEGDMIARNPKDHNDKWLVTATYFAQNFEAV